MLTSLTMLGGVCAVKSADHSTQENTALNVRIFTKIAILADLLIGLGLVFYAVYGPGIPKEIAATVFDFSLSNVILIVPLGGALLIKFHSLGNNVPHLTRDKTRQKIPQQVSSGLTRPTAPLGASDGGNESGSSGEGSSDPF